LLRALISNRAISPSALTSLSQRPAATPVQNQISEADRVGHLDTHFEFGARDHRLVSIFAFGSPSYGEKQAELNKLADAHPEWSDMQMTQALLSAGAKFGPD
jgi:hypothetical protein